MNNNLPLKVELKDLTTLKVGGSATVWEVRDEVELPEAIAYANDQGLGWRVLGGGSNILASDHGCTDLVIKMAIAGRSASHAGAQVSLTVGAGEVLDDVVAYCVSEGWWGLENLSHIPGTVGATPIQNVGAYGVEVKDIIVSVRVYDVAHNTFRDLSTTDCQFGYRDSVFKHEAGQHYIVTAVTYRLHTEPHPVVQYRDLSERFVGQVPTLADVRAAVIDIRSKKFPDWTTVGTAGSFFKNPIITRTTYETLLETYPELPMYAHGPDTVKIPLGYVFDKILAVRGVRDGAIGTHDGQALVLVNYGGATAAEITRFANALADQVKQKTDITIEWEVTAWTK